MLGIRLVKNIVQISDFKIENTPIAKSQSGIVYKAIRPAQRRNPEILCAVKHFSKTANIHFTFSKETSLHGLLKHITILPFVGYTIPLMGEGDYTLITEFMPNGTLREFLNRAETSGTPENFELIKAINIFGIAAGMAYIHQKDIIYRNLKPENVFLDEHFYPKIGDFALAKVLEKGHLDEISQTLNVGTPLYMAPEVSTDRHYNNKVDVFSYSILLYEFLTLRKPYSERKDIDISNVVSFVSKGERPTINKNEIPNVFENLLISCWNADPDERPSFIEIVKQFIDHKSEFFNLNQNDKTAFENYIELATKDLKF